MKKKRRYIYQQDTLLGTVVAALNLALAGVFGVRISKANSIAGDARAREVFKGCALRKSDHGYYCLDPMPTRVELDAYYSKVYWGSRVGKNYGANSRDFVHFHLLKKYVPDLLSGGKRVLNFGAGHGGISNLFWFEGLDVVNVEPSGLPQFYQERWVTYRSLDDAPENSVDLIYGSHSLEHVQNIDAFKEQVNRVIKPSGFLFWEVPNANSPENGARKNRADIPHTYYFFDTFFDDWFDQVILNKSYDESHGDLVKRGSKSYEDICGLGVIDEWEDCENANGSVIRALGRMK